MPQPIVVVGSVQITALRKAVGTQKRDSEMKMKEGNDPDLPS